ncbi:MAG: peptidase E [Prolixibacteraceae bacterium]|nr:peptidase E [Prolixibacteraceae bacterium]
MGKIVAIGGGENGRPGTNYETGAIDREIIAMTGKARPCFLFVGLANVHAEGYYNAMRNIYHGMYDCETEHLTADDIRDARVASSKIAGADIIYVGGGNTLRLMTLLRKHGVDKMLAAAYEDNKVLCGVSAGAICWCDYGNSDSRKFTSGSGQLIRVKGLGFVHVLMCPHFDAEPKRQADLPRMMKTTYGIPAVALDNGAALVINEDRFKIVTSIEGAKAKKYYWKKGEYFENTLDSSVGEGCIIDLYTR